MSFLRHRLWWTVVALAAAPGCSKRAGGAPRLDYVSQNVRLERSRFLADRLRRQPDADDPALWFEWGIIEVELGNTEIAAAKLAKAVNLSDGGEPRYRLFLAHACFAVGKFDDAYDHYRAASAGGMKLEDVLEAVRQRLGSAVEDPARAPGLAGVIELVAGEEREQMFRLAAELERAGDANEVDLRAVDLALFSAMARSDGWRERLSAEFLPAYLRDSGRAAPIDEEAFWRRYRASVRTGAGIDKLLAQLRDLELLAGGDLGELRLDSERCDADRIVLVADRASYREEASSGRLLELLNRVLEDRGSPRRFYRCAAEISGARPSLIVCITPRQRDLLGSGGAVLPAESPPRESPSAEPFDSARGGR